MRRMMTWQMSCTKLGTISFNFSVIKMVLVLYFCPIINDLVIENWAEVFEVYCNKRPNTPDNIRIFGLL